MGEGKPGERILRLLVRFIRLVLAGAIYALVLWYGVETTEDLDTPSVVTSIVIALVALGIAGSIYRMPIDVAKEAKGAIMVLADFLNTHLVEPQKRRLIERGRAQGRAETIADIRSRLLKEGIDPDRIIPLEDADRKDRC